MKKNWKKKKVIQKVVKYAVKHKNEIKWIFKGKQKIENTKNNKLKVFYVVHGYFIKSSRLKSNTLVWIDVASYPYKVTWMKLRSLKYCSRY